MNTNLTKFVAASSILALLGAGCMGSEPAPTTGTPDTKTPPVATQPTDTKPTDTGTKPADTTTSTPSTPTTPTTPTTGTDPDRSVDEKELPVIDGTWQTYTNAANKFSFQYPTKGRYAPEWNVTILSQGDARLEDGCKKAEANLRATPGPIVVGDTSFCIVREVDAGAGQRYYSDSFTAPRGDKFIQITFSKRLANGDLFEDESCHGKTVISSGTTCILFDEALYRAHLNQIVATYRHE
jgi:hypothetical protein